MSIGDQLKWLGEKALELHREYSTMSANFQNLERQFDRLIQANERFTDRVLRENEDLRRRLTTLEGKFEAVLVASAKEALIQVAREHLQKEGRLPGLEGFVAAKDDRSTVVLENARPCASA